MVILAKPINGRKIDPFKYPKTVPFPRYTKEEDTVAREFIKEKKWKGEYYFDVHLTSRKAKFVENLPAPLARLWTEVTAKRIDMLVVTRDRIRIVEVKRYMLSSGIGQLLTYRKMFKEEYRPNVPIELWYAVWYYDPDIISICQQLNINTWSYIK